MDLESNFGDKSFGFHRNQGMENVLSIDTGEIPALMKLLGKGKLLGQTLYTSLNSDLL